MARTRTAKQEKEQLDLVPQQSAPTDINPVDLKVKPTTFNYIQGESPIGQISDQLQMIAAEEALRLGDQIASMPSQILNMAIQFANAHSANPIYTQSTSDFIAALNGQRERHSANFDQRQAELIEMITNPNILEAGTDEEVSD